MKKIITCLLLITCLFACKDTISPDFSKPFELETYDCDMSDYDGMKASGHMFVGTTVSELLRTVDEKGYGVFCLSRIGCEHCQMTMKYLEEIAEELDITVYYIDAMSVKYPIVGTADFDVLKSILYDHLNTGDNGEKEIMTPHVFTIVDGEITSSYVGSTWTGNEPSEKDIEEMKNLYRKMLTPFQNQSQD